MTISDPEAGKAIGPGGSALVTPCGRKATFMLDVELRASGSTTLDEAVATLDSIDLDSGQPAHLTLEPCEP